MRQIILDTETTGLEVKNGDRVIEIGCVELNCRKLTQRRFHCYLNPGRPIDAGAQAVHGLTSEFLQDKPKFAEIAGELVEFLRGAELVIHNAAFDIGFIDHELSLVGMEPLSQICSGVIDTLRLAREMHPGRKHSLNALCSHFQVDNSGRTLHGALLDAELLAEVYLAMTRGQESLVMDLDMAPSEGVDGPSGGQRPPVIVLRAAPAELLEHQRVLAEIAKESKGKCLWSQTEAG